MADGGPEFDLVIVGSGAAGLTAALTAALRGLSAVVIEKTEYFGGSTARSGGGVWIPGNAVLRRAGITDTPAAASAYLAHVAGEETPASLRAAFLEHGPAMLDMVLANTPLRFAWVPNYSDYYPEAPGGKASGRSIEPVPIDGRILGPELARLRPPYLPAPAGITVTQANYRWMSLGTSHPRAIWTTARVTGRMIVTKVRKRRLLSMGQALITGLRAGLAAADVPVWLSTTMTALQIEDGKVTGVTVTRPDGEPVVLRARTGVAAGQRRVRAERGDAREVPARADRHRLDRRLAGQHRRGHPARRSRRRRA